LGICDKLIDYWKTASDKSHGKLYSNDNNDAVGSVNPSIKDSIDTAFPISGNKFSSSIFQEYYENILQPCVDKYIQKYPFCNNSAPWSIQEIGNIQYYKPGGGFKVWHGERSSAHPIASLRHLVYMTYLNDVIDTDEYHGGTEWLHQNVKIKAKKGYTVIWPADWTHTHRGIVSTNKEKYIITGWFSFTKI